MKIYERVIQQEKEIFKKHYWIGFGFGISVDVFGDYEELIGDCYRICVDGNGNDDFDCGTIVFECQAYAIKKIVIDVEKVELDSYFNKIKL